MRTDIKFEEYLHDLRQQSRAAREQSRALLKDARRVRAMVERSRERLAECMAHRRERAGEAVGAKPASSAQEDPS